MSAAGGAALQAACACDAGYYGAPPDCSALEAACEAGACLNGAACAVAPDGAGLVCSCAPGYTGNRRRRRRRGTGPRYLYVYACLGKKGPHIWNISELVPAPILKGIIFVMTPTSLLILHEAIS